MKKLIAILWLLAFPALAANYASPTFNTLSLTGGGSTGDVSGMSALATSGTTPRTLAAHFSDTIYARDRGIKCDGATDDTSAINALMTNLPSRSEVIFPSGTCLFSGTLTWQLRQSGVYGSGRQATLFLYDGANTTNDLIYVNGTGSSSVNESVAQGFSVQSETTMAAGAGIHAILGNYVQFRDVTATNYINGTTNPNTLWNAFWIDQPNFFLLDGFTFEAQNDNLAISALGVGTGNQYDVFVNNGKLGGANIGLHIGGGIDNVHADNVEDTSNKYNVVDDNAIEPYKNQEIYLGTNFLTDQGGQYNYYINDADANQANYCIVSIAGAVTHADGNGGGGDNIDIHSAPNCDINVSSPYIDAAARDGIRIEDSTVNLAISPATIITNNAEYGVNATVGYSNLLSMGSVYGNPGGQVSGNIQSVGQLVGAFQGNNGGNVDIVGSNNTAAGGNDYVRFDAASGNTVKGGIQVCVRNCGFMEFYNNNNTASAILSTSQFYPPTSGGMSLGTATNYFSNAYLQAETLSGTATFADSGTWASAGISGTAINSSSVGATTASTGAFTTLNASGNDAIDANTNTSSESIPSGSGTTITGWTTKFDRLGTNWNASTGTFTAPTSGIYVVNVGITFSATTAAIGNVFRVQVLGPGGAYYCLGTTQASTTTNTAYSASASCAVQANGGQTIVTQAYQNTGSPVTLSNSANLNYISIYRLP